MEHYILFVLSIFLLISGLAKLVSQIDFMKTLHNIGIARRLLKPVAIAVPVLEIVAAILLMIPMTQFIGGIVSLGLFVAFMIVVIKTMAQNKKVDCNCVGNLLPEEMGWSTIIRLIIMMAMVGYLLVIQSADVTAVATVDLIYQLLSSIGILGIYAAGTLMASNIQAKRAEGVR